MPPIPHRIRVRRHPGSSQNDVDNEPDWGAGPLNRIGYRNQQNRFPGLTHIGDEWGKPTEFKQRALKEQEELKSKIKKGEVVNFRDAITQQEVCLTLSRTANRRGMKKYNKRRIFIRITTYVDPMFIRQVGDTFLAPPKTGSNPPRIGLPTYRKESVKRKRRKRSRMRRLRGKKMNRKQKTIGSDRVLPKTTPNTTTHIPQAVQQAKSKHTVARATTRSLNTRSYGRGTLHKRSLFSVPSSMRKTTFRSCSRTMA